MSRQLENNNNQMKQNTMEILANISDETKQRAEADLRKSIADAYKDIKDEEELKQTLVNEICKEIVDIAKTHGEPGLRWLYESVKSENGRMQQILEIALKEYSRQSENAKE